MISRALNVVFIFLLALSSAVAHSAGVDAQLKARIVTKTNGNEVLRAADTASPGAVIDYQVTYSNKTTALVKHVLAVLPVPAGSMVYLPSSAKPAQVLASLDGKQFETMPLRRTVTRADGQVVSEIVPLNEYRFLRWDLGDLAAGETKVVSARMQVIDGSDQVSSISTGAQK